MDNKDFLDQFSNNGKPDSFKEEERVPVTKERKPLNIKLLILLLLLLLVLGIIGYFLFFAPKIVVPDFIDKEKSDVAVWVKQQGIESSGIVFEEQYDFDTKDGTILSQSIPAGKKVKKNVKMNFALSLGPDPEEKIKIPDIESMTKQELQDWISNNKLLKTKLVTAFNDDVAEDEVIDYSFVGCEADSFTRGCTLKINVSKGKTPAGSVTLEDFTNKTYEYVESWAKSKKVLLEKSEKYSDKIAEGNVISQSVESGKTMKEGEKLIVTVSRGKAIFMADMNEWSEAKIQAWCAKNGVHLANVMYRYDEEAKGECIYQSIPKGQLVSSDDYLEVIISKDDPDIRQFQVEHGSHPPYSELYNWIKECNSQGACLKVSVTYQLHDTIPIDHVISMSSKVHNEDTVYVVVSDGKNILLEDVKETIEKNVPDGCGAEDNPCSTETEEVVKYSWTELRKNPNIYVESEVRELCATNPDISCVFTYSDGGIEDSHIIEVKRSDGILVESNTYLSQRESIEIVVSDKNQ